MGNDFKGLLWLILRVGAETVFLVVWAMAAFLVDHVLLSHFPLESSSVLTLRGFEVIFNVSTFRTVFNALFRRDRPKSRRWKRSLAQLRQILKLALTLYLLGPVEQKTATKRAVSRLADRVSDKNLNK